MKEVIPYSKLAEIYDRMMDHVDYRHWSIYIKTLLKYADRKINTILDLSCGTGSFLKHFHDKKYDCIGSDSSLFMLQKAKKKSALKGIEFFANKAEEIALKSDSVDAILFLYDSLNYLHQTEDVNRLLKEIFRVLKSGGLFIFDVVTPYQCREYFSDYYENEFWGDSGYNRHSYYVIREGQQRNDFQIFEGNNVFEEHHVQSIYSQKELTSLIRSNGLKLVAAYENFTFMQAGKYAERIHFICKKNKQSVK